MFTTRPIWLSAMAMVVLGTLAACGGSGDGDPASRGKQIYVKLGCNACHAINGEGGQIGPDQTHVATTALERIKDPNYRGKAADAAAYIRESIVVPSAYVVPGYQDGVMPKAFAQQLSAQDLDDLVTYLLTLK